jgi:hypothetical protein
LLAHGAPSQWLLVTDLVAEVERDLGRRAAAFNLKIGVLPVGGIWSCQPRVDHVLVNRELRADDAAFCGFLARSSEALRSGSARACPVDLRGRVM